MYTIQNVTLNTRIIKTTIVDYQQNIINVPYISFSFIALCGDMIGMCN